MTLLQHIYIAIITALQRSADLLGTSLRRHAKQLIESIDDDVDGTLRARLQLLSMAQLCSFFIKRLDQTWDATMSSNQGPLYASISRGHDPWQSASSGSLGELKAEVEQRLRRLQESVYLKP